MKKLKKVIALDFDGTICTRAWPGVGAPNWRVIARAKREQENGADLVLWTTREGADLQAALIACARWGLHFAAVNESTQEWREAYGNNPRKIGATEYWDDRAVTLETLDSNPAGYALFRLRRRISGWISWQRQKRNFK